MIKQKQEGNRLDKTETKAETEDRKIIDDINQICNRSYQLLIDINIDLK
jgi:hypothetical protein